MYIQNFPYKNDKTHVHPKLSLQKWKNPCTPKTFPTKVTNPMYIQNFPYKNDKTHVHPKLSLQKWQTHVHPKLSLQKW